jgi:PAS domain S-box-containing protein
MESLTLLIAGAFYLLFAVSIRQYLRYRQPLELAVVLVFASTAAIFASSFLGSTFPALAPLVAPLSVILLVAQPALMVRLVGLVAVVPRWLGPLAFVGFLVSLGWFFATDRSVPATLFLVGYFTGTEAVAAVLLVREGRRRVGFPRIRLTMAGAASALFGLSILVAGVASAARGGEGESEPAVTAMIRSLALVAGLGYLVAFATPHWLRSLGYRSLAWDMVETIVSRPPGTDASVLWRALATVAAKILGTSHIRISTEGRVHLAPEAADDPNGFDVVVPLMADRGRIGTLEARLTGRPLFLEDDIALLELLGSLAAQSIEREQAIAALAEAQQAAREAGVVRASEERFRALLEAEPNAMLNVDEAGIVRWATRSAEQMFGVAVGGLVGRPLVELVVPPNEARRPGSDADATRYETTGIRADGEVFPADVALSALELDGAPAVLVVVSDVSWRREAEQMRDRFIGVLSHELRTPITSIYGGAQVLLRRWQGLDPDTRSELVSDVAGEAERLERMVENLLVLARVERGAEVADVGPVLLQRIVPIVAEREGASWPAMDIRVDPNTDLPPVAADDASISLILRNLISNAGKYAGPAARVRIAIETEDEGTVTVRVSDDGPGIAPEDEDKLFRLYYRSEAAAAAPGSGIGLFVCRALVTAMGGTIWGRTSEGGGADFGFSLPEYAEPSHAQPDARPVAIRAARAS